MVSPPSQNEEPVGKTVEVAQDRRADDLVGGLRQRRRRQLATASDTPSDMQARRELDTLDADDAWVVEMTENL